MQRFTKFAVAAVVALGLASFPTIVGAKGQKKAGGGSHSMTGCLQKGDDANTFKLTNVEGSGPKNVEIIGTTSGVDLSPHVGHKVTITGTAVGTKAAERQNGRHQGRQERTRRTSHACQRRQDGFRHLSVVRRAPPRRPCVTWAALLRN